MELIDLQIKHSLEKVFRVLQDVMDDSKDMHDKLEVMKGELANTNSELNLHLGWPPDRT